MAFGLGNNAQIKAVITAEDRASKTISNVSNSTSRFGAIAGRVAKTGLLALGAASIFSVKAFADQEKAEAQLNAVLKSTGHAAGVTADQAKKLSQTLMEQTTFADEDILAMENLLLTFTKINKKVFPEATKIALDMSVALGQDLKSSAIQVGKALQDPVLGVTALRRVGVNFSNDQREVIKKLVETGQQAKAQKLILKELATEFGGSASASAKTFSGQLQQLKNSIGELGEAAGAKLVPVLSAVTGAVKTVTDSIVANKTQVGVAEFSYGRFKTASENLKLAQDVVKASTKAVTKRQEEYNSMVAQFGPHSAEARKALAKLRLAQLKDAEAKASAKIEQQLLNAAEAHFIKATAGVSKAIQKRALKFGIIVDQIGTAKLTAQRLDDILSNITPKAVDIGGFLEGAKRGGLRIEARQHGGPVQRGQPYVVGEKRPELFVPNQSGKVIPEIRTSPASNQTIHLNVKIGMYAGTEIEKRKVAREIFKAAQDLANARGKTLTGMFG